MLTIYEDDANVFESLCAGASGYLLKGGSTDKIIAAIKEVQAGGAPMNAQIAKKVLAMFTKIISPHADYALTEREKEILNLLVSGKPQKANRLYPLSQSVYHCHAHEEHLREAARALPQRGGGEGVEGAAAVKIKKERQIVMKNVKLVPMILAMVAPLCIMAQTLAPQVLPQNSYPFRQGHAKGDRHYGPFQRNAPRPYPGRMQKKPLAFPAHYQNGSLDEPARFPHQDSAASYFYSCPVALANGKILMVWLNELGDRIYCAASSDTGTSWAGPVVVGTISPGLSISFSITGVQTNTGRVIVFWELDGTIFSSRSDDNGASWTTPTSFVTVGSVNHFADA